MCLNCSRNKRKDTYVILRDRPLLRSLDAVFVLPSCEKFGAADNKSRKCNAVQIGTILPNPDAEEILGADQIGESEQGGISEKCVSLSRPKVVTFSKTVAKINQRIPVYSLWHLRLKQNVSQS